MELGTKIMNMRKEKKLTQETLGELMNVSYMTIRRWENKKSKPSLDQLHRLAEIFHVSMEYLINDDADVKVATMLKRNEGSNFQNLTSAETDNMLIYKDGEQVIYLTNTPENQRLFRSAIHSILDRIYDNSENGNNGNKNFHMPYTDITQTNIGRDATVTIGTNTTGTSA